MVFPRLRCFDSARLTTALRPSGPIPFSLYMLPACAPLGRPRPRPRPQALGSASLWEGAGLLLMPVSPALWALVRVRPQWAHQAALVSGEIRSRTLTAPHPQPASAAAWLNNSSGLVYASLPGGEWLSRPPHRPLRGPAALASVPSPTWPPESCSKTGPCALAMHYSGLVWLESG